MLLLVQAHIMEFVRRAWESYRIRGKDSWCPDQDSSPVSLGYKQEDLLYQFDGFRDRDPSRDLNVGVQKHGNTEVLQ